MCTSIPQVRCEATQKRHVVRVYKKKPPGQLRCGPHISRPGLNPMMPWGSEGVGGGSSERTAHLVEKLLPHGPPPVPITPSLPGTRQPVKAPGSSSLRQAWPTSHPTPAPRSEPGHWNNANWNAMKYLIDLSENVIPGASSLLVGAPVESAILYCPTLTAQPDCVTYSVFPGTPLHLNDAEVVQRHGSKEHFGRVGIAQLPYQRPPCLAVLQDVRPDRDIEVVLDIEEGGPDRSPNQPHHQDASHGRTRKRHGYRFLLNSSLTGRNLGSCYLDMIYVESNGSAPGGG
ncbi:hypothetical protein CHGG_08175 [Chaetomium globosum CBS 148.51]|uniref:Uncharacterized protein n=1 Tax=Chaetomium globosum (strain ATCC 6205 / CBS 148.51 / DSM 1962 / NBRC 6347 / NRRL 1970) TaxID=306901 RepID=Q2GV29_CHAGB|nr:uncharacterized protein CHGG_08175 [Chaetomium globosum CBS 148.51]EAQ86922.1 hypothetical protein CHGG_08175 [Chaetomium globosum CBS 148.51]